MLEHSYSRIIKVGIPSIFFPSGSTRITLHWEEVSSSIQRDLAEIKSRIDELEKRCQKLSYLLE